MTDVTSIANRALDRLGAQYLSDIATDQTKEAKIMNRMFAIVRDAELRKHYWKFAKTRLVISPLVAKPAFDWNYAYQLPNGFIRVYSVNEFTGPDYQVDYEIEGSTLLTNAGTQLYLKYIQRVTDPNLFDPLFVESFACMLAWQACEEITQSNTKKQALAQEYSDIIKAAKRIDALEQPPQDMPEGSWLTSRL